MNKKYLAFAVLAIVIASAVLAMANKQWRSDADHPLVQTAAEAKNIAATHNSEPSEVATTEKGKANLDLPPDQSPPASQLADYPGFGHDIDKDEEQFSAEENAREKLIATCMQASGFEYTPAPSIVVDEKAINNPKEFERLLIEASTNPNDAYVNALTPEMRKAYYVALTGLEDPNEEEGQAHDYAEQNGSCTSEAFRAVPGVYNKRNQLSDAFDAMESSIGQDARILNATKSWSDCMKNAGYAFSRPSDILRDSDDTLTGLLERGADKKQLDAADNELTKTMNASHACADKVKLGKIRQGVRIEYENRFVNEYKSQLDDATAKSGPIQ